jgi:hypothetical protein
MSIALADPVAIARSLSPLVRDQASVTEVAGT